MNIDLIKLIKVFDEHNEEYQGHTTSIIEIFGEDLNAGLFKHYLDNLTKKKTKILPYKVKTGWPQGKGPQLDRWIKAGKILYQTEIKSWCCFQTGGGYKLPINASVEKIKKEVERKWQRELGREYVVNNKTTKDIASVNKVLVEMKVPKEIKKEEFNKVKPLVIHWMPISAKGVKPFSSVSLKSIGIKNIKTKENKSIKIPESFKEINYFSCSLYIRELLNKNITELNLNLPNANKRIDIINEISKL